MSTEQNDPFSDAVIESKIKEMLQKWAARSDLANIFYKDRDALFASGVSDDLYYEICENGLNIPGINCDLIRQRENGTSEDAIGKDRQVNAEIEKINKYVSQITGVSLGRINKATKFWLDSVLD